MTLLPLGVNYYFVAYRGTLYKLLGKLKLDIFLKVILIHKPTPIKMDRLCRNPSIFIKVIEFLQRFMYPDSI